MPLFQSTVVSKYLKSQDKIKLVEKWELYKSHFLNPVIQENIRNSKEEQYQEGFLRDLFVKILGYTLNPEHNFNLTTELKNVKDSKKADGGIIINEKVIGVVELKGTNTTDLGKVEEQAFGYKNNQSECIYVITSNFEKLRFYIDNAIEHIEFNLFTLTEPDFQLLYLCLAFENININIPKRLKEESLSQEELITKQLYKDYSLFKRELFQNLCELNPPFEPLELFKKSQKLLDRCLFLLFSEDRNLLPPNSVRLILKQWKQLHELDAYSPLYDRFKKYFGYLNTGFKGKQYDVFAYNGGLFKPDAVLDTITIDDDLLYRHTYKLSEYDFQSEVDVNILGHIFENSLNELDEISAQLEGLAIDKSNTKRKKDGVFYTPKYITKYIVENTIGKLCEEKKAELDITDEAYQPAKQRSRKRLDNLNFYRNWLLQLTICDPACGSGAFLNQALDFLINEHRYIDELSAKYNKDAFILSDVEKSILENNLFGVDLNEESVEIAKLSLWLRTAQPNRKLNDLSGNIKCGNSLIDDASVAGEKAFNWEKEFPQIFEKGGFDVVIGNPPYVRADSPGNELKFREYLVNESKFKTLSGKWDLYIPFIELSDFISSNNGLFSLIIPDAYCHAEYAKSSLEFYTLNNKLHSIDYFPGINVFQNVGVQSVIVNFIKPNSKLYFKKIHTINQEIEIVTFNNYPSSFRYDFRESLMNRNNLIEISDVFYISKGIVGNSDEKKWKGEFKVGDLINDFQDDKFSRLYYEGKNIEQWFLKDKRFIEFGTERSPSRWSRKGFPELFTTRKIVTMRSPGQIPRSFIDDEKGFYNESAIGFVRWCDLKGVVNNSIVQQYVDDRIQKENISEIFSLEECLAYFSSKLFKYELNANRRSNIHIYPDDWRNLKLPNQGSPALKKLAVQMLELNQEFRMIFQKFQRALQREFEQLDKLSKKLENWYELSYADFLKELKKKKIELSLSQKAEWEDYFLAEQQKALQLQNQITLTDKEINAMVYELYGLNKEEIEIVENS